MLIRVFVSDPGTPSAEACIAYCRPGEEEEVTFLLIMMGSEPGLRREANHFFKMLR